MGSAAIFLLSLLLSLGLLAGCDQDPFGRSTRHLAGPYSLLRWEDGTTFYVTSAAETFAGGGALGGTVDSIGWNASYILARRIATFRGDPDGWMLIDVNQGKIRGPFSDAEFAQLSEAKGMRIVAAAEAWGKLN
jgi:hypothetical protein